MLWTEPTRKLKSFNDLTLTRHDHAGGTRIGDLCAAEGPGLELSAQWLTYDSSSVRCAPWSVCVAAG